MFPQNPISRTCTVRCTVERVPITIESASKCASRSETSNNLKELRAFVASSALAAPSKWRENKNTRSGAFWLCAAHSCTGCLQTRQLPPQRHRVTWAPLLCYRGNQAALRKCHVTHRSKVVHLVNRYLEARFCSARVSGVPARNLRWPSDASIILS